MDCKGLKESLAHISVVFLLRIASESCKDTNFCVLLKTCHIVSFYFYTCLSYYETKHCLEHDPHEMDIMSAFIHSYFQPLMQGLACRQHSVSTK